MVEIKKLVNDVRNESLIVCPVQRLKSIQTGKENA